MSKRTATTESGRMDYGTTAVELAKRPDGT